MSKVEPRHTERAEKEARALLPRIYGVEIDGEIDDDPDLKYPLEALTQALAQHIADKDFWEQMYAAADYELGCLQEEENEE